MKNFIVTTSLIVMLLTFTSLSQGQVSIGIRIGPPPAPIVAVAPARPGPGHVWIDGYWYPVGNHYKWHKGYWTLAPYEGAHWMGPRYQGGEFFQGYWEGSRGRVEHDHHWDNKHDRDNHYSKGHDHDHDRDHH